MIALLFDIDGTLISTGGAGQAALDLAFNEAFGISRVHEVPISGRTDRGIARDLFLQHGVEDSTEHWHRLRATYLSYLPRQLHVRPGRVLPGVRELLAYLSTRQDISMGLLTGNVQEGARIKLSHFSMFHFFQFGGFGDDSFDRNHVAEIALARAQSHAATIRSDHHKTPDSSTALTQTWVIGDTPLDIRCARAIGAQVCAVATGSHPPDELAANSPDVLLHDLTDWEALLSETIERRS